MMRATAACAWSLLVAISACKSSGPKPSPNDTTVRPWTEVAVPGVKMFTTHPAISPPDYDARGAYLQHDVDARKLTGKDAMRVVVAKGITDPVQLATLSQLFLDSIGGQLVSTAGEARGDRAAPRVAPPIVKDGILEYWHWTGGMAHYIQRSRVNLITFDREVKSVHQLEAEE
jgi:hypothetical protein